MKSDDVVLILVALAGGGFLASLVQGILQRRKMGADYADVIAKSATGLLKPLSDRVRELEESLTRERRSVDRLRGELAEARREVHALREELAVVRRENSPNERESL